MSIQYDKYLYNHRENVKKGFEWLRDVFGYIFTEDYEWQICAAHDQSKDDPEEYEAYDDYFYGGNRSYACVQEFNKAWLHHIHNNPHHWQHWVLINDDPKEGTICIEMPEKYIFEMICDWWAFSWGKGNLYEIFKWYDEHKAYIKLHEKSRKKVELILAEIKLKLDEIEKEKKDG